MALDLKINVQTTDDCRNLVIEDVTGNYSATNPGGWGQLNISPSSLEYSITIAIQVYIGDEDSVRAIEGSFKLGAFDDSVILPNKDSLKGFKLSVTNDMLNAAINTSYTSKELSDGLIVVKTLLVHINDSTDIDAEDTVEFINKCMVSNLVDKTLTAVNTNTDLDDPELIERVLLAKSLLTNLN